MKAKIWKTLVFFISTSLPLNWILGFAVAMLYDNKKTEANFLLYGCVMFSAAILMGGMIDYMKLKEIKGWYAAACTITSFGMFVLSMLIYLF